MRYSTKEPGLFTAYVPYPHEMAGKCFCCGEPMEGGGYVTAGHRYRDFAGEVNEIRRMLKCANPECELHGVAYNPTPGGALPYKRFSLAVWKWIAEEAKLHNQNPRQIRDRAQEQFDISISENTIRNYIDEIDILLGNEIDEKTRRLLLVQGVIVLALDGQKPDENGKALWIFVDLVSNRVLKVAILESADSGTLHALVEAILQQYHVKMVGMVSDKQNNLTKLRDDWYPAVPHQFCHFHFLQNLWNHAEVKDCGLHQQLAKGVKHLYITSASKQAKVEVAGRGKLPVREVFKKVEGELRRLVKTRTKKFDNLRGVEAYEGVRAYVDQMVTTLARADGQQKGIALLNAAAAELQALLGDARGTYDACKELDTRFQEIRQWLGKDCPSKGAKLSSGDHLFSKLWQGVKGAGGVTERTNLRTFLPHKDTPLAKIEQEFVRLYDSYRPGLFAYFDFPAPVKTNSVMEESIGLEKGRLRQRNGKANVGMQVRIRGEYELKQVYAGKDEVRGIIKRMGPQYSLEDLKTGLLQLAARRNAETAEWRTEKDKSGFKDVVQFLSSQEAAEGKQTREEKRD